MATEDIKERDTRREQAAIAPRDVAPSSGQLLLAARERRAISLADAATQSRIPRRYLEMIENGDYSMVSDRLYLLPFVRRYACFLELDTEETATRFVREVQRTDLGSPIRGRPESAPKQRRKRPTQFRPMLAVATIAAVFVAAYLFEVRRLETGGRNGAAFDTPATSRSDAGTRAAKPESEIPSPRALATTLVPVEGGRGEASIANSRSDGTLSISPEDKLRLMPPRSQ